MPSVESALRMGQRRKVGNSSGRGFPAGRFGYPAGVRREAGDWPRGPQAAGHAGADIRVGLVHLLFWRAVTRRFLVSGLRLEPAAPRTQLVSPVHDATVRSQNGCGSISRNGETLSGQGTSRGRWRGERDPCGINALRSGIPAVLRRPGRVPKRGAAGGRTIAAYGRLAAGHHGEQFLTCRFGGSVCGLSTAGSADNFSRLFPTGETT